MELSEYQSKAHSTAIYPSQGEMGGLLYTSLGMVGEAGEFCNKVKKILRDDAGVLTASRREDLIQELGDVLWYLAETASELRADLNVVGLTNLDKLSRRKVSGSLHGSGDAR